MTESPSQQLRDAERRLRETVVPEDGHNRLAAVVIRRPHRFSNAWNRTQPYWVDAAAINDSLARSHLVLTQGLAKMDVGVYIVAQILAQPKVSQVASEADVPAKLASLRAGMVR